MKKFVLFIFCVSLVAYTYAQDFTEKNVKTDIKEITVFTEGCQIVRQKSVDLPQGELLLKFTGLSPFIDAKSIQLKTDGELMILSVNHQTDHLKSKEKSKETLELETKIEELNNKLLVENAHKTTLNDELNFLAANIKIGGTNQTVNAQQLKEAFAFYNEKTTEVRLKMLEKDKVIKDLQNELTKCRNQLNTNADKKESPLSEILVKLENKKAGKVSFELSYIASNAGWLPTYDIIAKNIDEPIRIVYKANIHQNTKEDWTNVKLRLSSANPNKSGVAPTLRPYYVSYGSRPPVYTSLTGLNNNVVTGRVYDEQGEGLPYTNVIVVGTTIGTNTDDNGYYQITLPNQSTPLSLQYSFVGFIPQTIPVNNRQVINVSMREDGMTLDEVVTVGFGTQARSSVIGSAQSLQGRVAGVSVSDSKSKATRKSPIFYEAEQVRNQTTVDFEIKKPYSIPSDGKGYTVSVEEYAVPAGYEYFCAPKADKDVFLMANITDWEDLNLLEGEANIFFENTYIGKTLIDTRTASDTLILSLGRDKSVTVKRELQKSNTSKRFIGSKKEENRSWKITVRNNKLSNINLQLVDQIPVSQSSDVEVKQQNISGAKMNSESGELIWNLTLPPKQNKEIDVQYMVKYPKSWNLIIE